MINFVYKVNHEHSHRESESQWHSAATSHDESRAAILLP